MAIDTIKFKRGVKSKLNNLSYGEPAYISDENELYIGTEDGVEKITRNKEVAELSSQLEHNMNEISEQFNTINQQIPIFATNDDVEQLALNKADKIYVEQLTQGIVNGSPKGVYTSLSELKSAIPQGNNNIYLTLDNGKWNYWNESEWVEGGVYQSTSLSNYSINRNHLNFIYEKGVIVAGELNFNFASDILEITTGTVVSTNNGFYACNNTGNVSINHDSFVRYLYFNIDTCLFHIEARWYTGKANELFICAIYGKKVFGVGNNDLIKVNGKNISIRGSIVTNENINDNSLANSKMAFATHYGAILLGGINIDTVSKKITVESNTIISDMLGMYAVNEGEIEFSNDTSVACYLFFDKSTNNVHLENRWFYSQNSNELFLGVVYLNKIFNSVSESITVNNKSLNTETNQWSDKKWVSYGDSNTLIGRWQPTVISKLGLNHINMGVSSSTIVDYSTWAVPMCSDERLNEIPNDTDIITILGGTNDWVGHKPLGTIDSVNKNEFYGAYKYIIESIMTRIPNARLLLLCPGYSSYTQTTGEKNNIGLTIRDYGNAIKEIGEYYNLPVIDLLSLMGVNKFNYLSCFDDEAIAVHFNVNGGVRVGNIVAETVKQL